MEDYHLYTTMLEWEDGRRGDLSVEGFPAIRVATPPEFKSGEPNIWSPEHLFVASVNSCLMTTFLAIAENSNLEFESFKSEAVGKLEKIDGKFVFTEIELNPLVHIKHEKDRDRAVRIIEKAEHNCLISNSIKTKIILTPEVKTK